MTRKDRVVTVDLSDRKVVDEHVDPEVIGKYLGGRGLGAYLYSLDVRPYDDPKNSVYMVPGMLTGTAFPSSSRMQVVSTSPLTGWMISSSAGGMFGAYLKSLGIAALGVSGVSAAWVYLEITQDGISVFDASDLAGKNIYETRDILKKKYDGRRVSIASIGRGGEQGVRYACVQFDNRSAGRAGAGWQFGFKKLKAIVVEAGELPVSTADEKQMTEIVERLRGVKAKHELDDNVETYCTAPFTSYATEVQAFPASNYRRNFVSPEEIDGFNQDTYKKHTVAKEACWSCPLACTRITKSRYSDAGVKGPEYETLWSLGASPDVFDLDVVIECNRLCDEYGLDTISTGSVLAWYKECIDRGHIDETWSPELMFALIEKIGEREGVGDVLAEGVVKAAEKLGFGQEYAAHSKGMELPAWDPRTALGMAVCYATAPTGGDHGKGWTVTHDVSDKVNRLSTEGKVDEVIKSQDAGALRDSLGLCVFADFLYDYDVSAACMSAYLGRDASDDELQKVGASIFNLEHEINVKLGQKLSDNVLPPRIIGYEVEVDGNKFTLTKEVFGAMMDEYCLKRGWKK